MLHSGDWIALIAYYLVLAALSAYGVHRFAIVSLYFRYRSSNPRPIAPLRPLPRVTVQLPIYNEVYVVERLLAAVTAIDYPRELVEIQVLDDSTDDTVEVIRRAVARYRQSGFDIVHLHRASREGFKAGALERGCARARGDLLLIFDADFIPAPDILRRSVDFFSDPAVGMVQTRWSHVNRDYSLLTRIQSIFLDGHFVIEHTARNRSGRFFNFNGTAGLWRKSAVIDSGGWRSDTLTEDLDLSYRAQLRGWRFVYLLDCVSPAELPVDMNGFKSQQHRWAKGSIQTARKLLPQILRKPLPLKVKVEAFFHLTDNVSYPLMMALSALIVPAMVLRHRMGWTRWIWLDFPLFFSATLSVLFFYVVSQREIGADWKNRLRDLPFLMSLGIGLSVNNTHAVLSAFSRKESEFTRTPKYRIESADEEWHAKKYRARRNFSVVFEIALAAYFLAATVLSVASGLYLGVPFLWIFFCGYAYTAALSLAQLSPRLLRLPRAAPTAP
jgi:cellulose synthase/poly-beta-1,6-N-acetylglucosamine synthase-like glycosyltransferase